MRIPNAQTYEEWTAAGKEWDPDLHFTLFPDDEEEYRFLNWLIYYCHESVAAYSTYLVGNGPVSCVELQFRPDRQEQLQEIRRIIESSTTPTGKLKRRVRQKFAKFKMFGDDGQPINGL